MKLVDYYWDHPILEKYRKEVRKGTYLFRRGEPGITFFIIVKGLVQLVAHRNGRDYFLHVLEAGQFLGEKMVLSDTMHERAFTAQAKTPLTVIEFSLKDIEFVRTNAPELMTDILKRMFVIAAERLDRANHLAYSLFPASLSERIVGFLMHLARYSGSTTPHGIEIPLIPSEVSFYIEADEKVVLQHLDFLAKIGLVQKQTEGCLLLPDLKKLANVGKLIPQNLSPITREVG